MYGIVKRATAISVLTLATVAIWEPEYSLAQEQMLSEVHTLTEDTLTGLLSDVTLVLSDKTTQDLGKTDENGILNPNKPCNTGMDLVVRPRSGHYKKTIKDVVCANPEVVKVQPVQIRYASREAENLLKNIDNVDEPALTALLYNELAREFASNEPDLSKDYAERAVYAFRTATEYDGEPLMQGSTIRLTPGFIEHIRQKQPENFDGRLDYLTFAIEADRDVFWFRHGVYSEPGTVPARGVQCPKLTLGDVITGRESSLVSVLVHAAEEKARMGEYGNAALLFNEAHARAGEDTRMAVYTERRVYENVGSALNVTSPVRCDPIQQRFVMTPTMFAAVLAKQPTAEKSGILGYQTIRSLANIDVGTFLAPQSN